MTARNDTAIGTHRTLQGTGLGCDGQWHQHGETSQWADFRRDPDGWCAYNSDGVTWRITEPEAAAIAVRLDKRHVIE